MPHRMQLRNILNDTEGNGQHQINCEVCSKIVKHFYTPSATITRFGDIHKLMKSRCPAHSNLFQYLYSIEPNLGSGITSKYEFWDDVQLYWTGGYYGGGHESNLSKIVDIRWRRTMLHLSISPTTNLPDLAPRTRPVDINWMDISLLKGFKENCECHHDRCNDWPLRKTFVTKPQYLIDVTNLCVVSYPIKAKYVILSYVWGGATILTATKDNFSQLKMPGELRRLASLNVIPRTILHAIKLTELLGERYLWCDALCVLQDDENKHIELANMASIYVNASLTIIAANSDNANHGLPGLRGVSSPRTYNPISWRLHESVEIHLAPGLLESSTKFWKSRGWTFQELRFSCKLLVFYDNTVKWSCSFGNFYEHMSWPYDGDTGQRSGISCEPFNFLQRIPLLWDLERSVSDFNCLDLTYPEDALDAFAGFMNAYGASYGDFVSGLPMIFFNLALLWEMSGDIAPRVARNRVGTICTPSWSWAGWKGSIDSRCWVDVAGQVTTPTIGRIVPYPHSTIIWQSHLTRDGPRTTINFSWSSRQTRFIDNPYEPLPSNWKRYSKNDVYKHLNWCHDCEKIIQPKRWGQELAALHRLLLCDPHHDFHTFPQCDSRGHLTGWYSRRIISCPDSSEFPKWQGRYMYIHSSQPGKPFEFPIPVPEDGYIPSITYAPFISGTTWRAWFRAGGLNSGNTEHKRLIDVLLESCDEPAGCLNPQVDILLGERIELIELAECQLPPGGGDEFRFPEMSRGGFYDTFYVMCIKWEDGVAYRRGIGRIKHDIWLRERKEQICVTLG